MSKLNFSYAGLWLFCFTLTIVLSCTDHEVPSDLPESKCLALDGSPRLYPCEFVIERIAFVGAGGTELDVATFSGDLIRLSRFSAKTNTNSGYLAGSMGFATYDVKILLRRVAAPSFPVDAGYLIGFTHNSAGKSILHTPGFPGDTYGERTKLTTVPLTMAIGETQEITVELGFSYQLVDGGMAGVVPFTPWSLTSFFVDNDVTTLKFPRTVPPYHYVGSVVEAYYEKLSTQITN